MSKPPISNPSKLALGAVVGVAAVGAAIWGLLASSGSDVEPEASTPQLDFAAAQGPEAAFPNLAAPAEPQAVAQEPAARVALATPPQLVMERPRIFHGGDPIEGLFYLVHSDAPNGQVLAPRVNFVLEVAFEGAVRSLDVEVLRGAWSCKLPVPFREVQRLEVRDVQIDGRRCESRAPIEPNVGGEAAPSLFVVRGQCAWDARLEVVDALSRRSLPTALVVPVEANQQLVTSEPDLELAQPLRETPLDLAPLANSMTEQAFFVSSPGYAWQRIVVDLRRDSFQRVELLPGGELAVHGTPASGELELVEVGPAGPGRRVALLSRFGLPRVLRGLPAGEYELRTLVEAPSVEPVEGSPRVRTTIGKLSVQTPEGLREFEAVEFIDGRLVHLLVSDEETVATTPIQLRLRITAGARTELVLDP